METSDFGNPESSRVTEHWHENGGGGGGKIIKLRENIKIVVEGIKKKLRENIKIVEEGIRE